MSLTNKLNQIKTIKNEIKQALASKNVDITSLPFSNFPTAIMNITTSSGESVDLTDVEDSLYNILYPAQENLTTEIITNLGIINEDFIEYTASETDTEDGLIENAYQNSNEVIA